MMSQFIDINDYDASIHREILDALVRQDQAIIEVCEHRAIAEMQSYLSARYNCQKLFDTRGDARHQLVLMIAIDIAVYHIFCIHNPRNLSEVRKDRYERAIEWLKAVAKGTITIPDAPVLEHTQAAIFDPIIHRSNRKRINRF